MKKLRIYLTVFSLFFIFLSGFNSSYAQKRKPVDKRMARIIVKMKDAKLGDTIRLVTFNNIYSQQYSELSQPHKEFIATQNLNREFVFNIPVEKKLLYISLYKDKVVKSIWPEPYVSILRAYLIEPNDKITIDIIRNDSYHPNDHLINNKIPEIEWQPTLKYFKAYSLHFSGNGVSKFKLRHLLDGILQSNSPPFDVDSTGKLNENPAIIAGSKIWKNFEGKINPLIYSILKADFIGEIEAQQLRVLLSYKRYDLITQYFGGKKLSFSDEVVLNSRLYPFFLIRKYNIEYPIPVGEKSLSYGAYYAIKRDFNGGSLRDKLLAIYLTQHSERLQNSVLEDAKTSIKTPLYLQMALDVSNQITTGKKAYNFELTNTSGKKVKLNDYRGKVVFMDFWFTGCSACKMYYRDIVSKAEEKMSADTNVVFLTISIDRNNDEWLKSVKKGDYTSDKVINLYTDGKGQLHPVISKYQVHAYPRPILIGKNGQVITDKQTDLVTNGLDKLINTINKALQL